MAEMLEELATSRLLCLQHKRDQSAGESERTYQQGRGSKRHGQQEARDKHTHTHMDTGGHEEEKRVSRQQQESKEEKVNGGEREAGIESTIISQG